MVVQETQTVVYGTGTGIMVEVHLSLRFLEQFKPFLEAHRT